MQRRTGGRGEELTGKRPQCGKAGGNHHHFVTEAESRRRVVTVPVLSLMVQPHHEFWAPTVLPVIMAKAVVS